MKRLVLLTLACFAAAGCDKKRNDPPPANNQGGPFDVKPGAGPGAFGVHGAVDRVQLNAALEQIQIFIQNASIDEMPSVETTYEVLKKEAPKYAKWIDEGLITLNPARTREDVWAYAKLPQGNYSVLTSSGIQPMTLQELNQRLGRGN